MRDALARLKAANADFERRDRSLREELREARETPLVMPEGRLTTESIDVGGQRVSQAELSRESIVRAQGRPVLAVFRNQARLTFEEPDSRIWKERLERASAGLAQAAAAVGRVEVQGHSLAWLGTGWLVSPDIVVTNRHVAAEFGRRRGEEFVFRQSLSGTPMSASIDFLEELERTDSLSFALSEILHIEDDDGPDIAFLRVRAAGAQPLARPIALAPRTPEVDEAVAVIGYPARDSRIPDVDLMERIYGNKYEKKRLAPGLVMRASGKELQHDCTTLGGNSGSAVISLASGEAVGLHFAGTFLTANLAVPSTVVRQRLDLILQPRVIDRALPPALRPPREVSTPQPPAVTMAPTGTSPSLSFDLPVRVTVSIGAPVTVNGAGELQETQPPLHEKRKPTTPRAADARSRTKRIPWSAELLSLALRDVLDRHDFTAAERLVAALERHVAKGSSVYPALYATRDLAILRKKRQFALMRRYAEAVIASGSDHMRVHREYGQALIELGEFDAGRAALRDVVKKIETNHGEAFEALGLCGRSYKQQYVDDPEALEGEDRMRHAVESYQSVYDRDHSMLWHGVNVASSLMRASRAGMKWADPARARQIAEALLTRLDALEAEARKKQHSLDVWDHAVRIEALVLLNRIPEAESALDAYLTHPEMEAFEVSSTHRQFSQVLQMDPSSTIMRRLSQAVERFRGGGALRETTASPTDSPRVSVLLRVSDPNWQPSNLPDVKIRSRAGAIISAEASRASLRALLQDRQVMTIEESRPGGTAECVTSVPNIHVQATYPGPGGTTYTETGDEALVAVIDDGIDINHKAFLASDGRTCRIVAIWDQTGTGTPPPPFNYGAYYGPADIANALTGKNKLGITPRGNGHGTHVASIAAGRQCGVFGGGVAPDARLLIVITDNQSDIGYSTQHVDALTFIDAEATRLGRPVVVNVSQGMNAGAHDGRSPLEERFNAFCTQRDGRVVVKSAGNEGDQNGHARFSVGKGLTKTLKWRRPQMAVGRHEHVEVWWTYGNEFEFTLGSPSGEWSVPVVNGSPTVTGTFGATRYELALVPSEAAHGDGVLRIDLRNADGIDTGVWQLKVLGRQVKRDAPLHAWIERGASLPSTFTTFQSSDVTLTIPGTAAHVITVGAVGRDKPFEVEGFSSIGPTRIGGEKPDVVAPGFGIEAALAGTTDQVIANAGTSQAAPHVAGAIALALSKSYKAGNVKTARQIAVALQQHTQSDSPWNSSEGWGVVDVAAFLASI